MGRVPHGRQDVGRAPTASAAGEGRALRLPSDMGAHACGLAARESHAERRRAARVGGARGLGDALERARGALVRLAETLAALDARRCGPRGLRARHVGRGDRPDGTRKHGGLPVQALDRAGGGGEQEGRPVAGASAATLPALPGVAWASPGDSEGLGNVDGRSRSGALRPDGRRTAHAGTARRGRAHELGNRCRHPATGGEGSRRAGGKVGA